MRPNPRAPHRGGLRILSGASALLALGALAGQAPGADAHPSASGVPLAEQDGNPKEVAAWMNWVDIPGLTEPAPGAFLRGVNPMPVGSTAYFTVDLVPGRYLFVSEYTGAMGVMREFRIQP